MTQEARRAAPPGVDRQTALLTLVGLLVAGAGGVLVRDALTRPADRRTASEFQTLVRSEEHTSELQSRQYLVCRLLLEKKQHSVRLSLASLPIPRTWRPYSSLSLSYIASPHTIRLILFLTSPHPLFRACQPLSLLRSFL